MVSEMKESSWEFVGMDKAFEAEDGMILADARLDLFSKVAFYSADALFAKFSTKCIAT